MPTLLGLGYGVLSTGLIVGVLWGRGTSLGTTSGEASLPLEISPGPSVVFRGLSLLVGQLLGVQGADGVGLRAYKEPALGDTHARELLSQHVHPQSCGRSWGDVRVVPIDMTSYWPPRCGLWWERSP